MSYVRLESGETKWVGKIKKDIECGNQEPNFNLNFKFLRKMTKAK